MRLKTEDDKYGKDSIGRSLGDLLDQKTPYLTPVSSPQLFTPLNCSPYNCSLYNQHGFNHLFESTSYKPVLRTDSITYLIKKKFERSDVKTTEHCDIYIWAD